MTKHHRQTNNPLSTTRIGTDIGRKPARSLPIASEEEVAALNINKGGQNTFVTDGFVEITSIGETTVEGSVVDSHDNITVNGHFEATRCNP